MELHSWWMTGARSPTRGFIHRDSSPSPQSQSPRATEKRQPGQQNCQEPQHDHEWGKRGEQKGRPWDVEGSKRLQGRRDGSCQISPLLSTIFEPKPQFLQYHLSLHKFYHLTHSIYPHNIHVQYDHDAEAWLAWKLCLCLRKLPHCEFFTGEVLPESKGV